MCCLVRYSNNFMKLLSLCMKPTMLEQLFCRKYSTELLKFVPKHKPALDKDIDVLRDFIKKSDKIVVLTGAGISTESGIPDYRSAEVGLYARTNHKPVQYLEFLKSSEVRRRYWARNYVGWHTFSKRQPNQVHHSIRNLEHVHNKVSGIITQNVDGLHFKAGSSNVIELHGTAFRVICLQCRTEYDRFYIQDKLREMNPHMMEVVNMIRPDGDVEIPQETVEGFQPPICESCGGILKPDIIFFGDNVPRARVEAVRNNVSQSDSLLVLGSSLTVFSSYRIVLQALEENINIAIVNIGTTRADKLVKIKISARCGDILPKIC